MPEQQIAHQIGTPATPEPEAEAVSAETTAPGAPASPTRPADSVPAADKTPQSHADTPHVESQTPENKNKQINPSPEDANAAPVSLPEK